MKIVVAAVLALALLIVGGFYLYVDRTIVARLEYQKPNTAPAVYSDSFRFNPGQRVAMTIFRTELISRGYREIDGPVRNAGEFNISRARGDIFTREFQDSLGRIQKARRTELVRNGDHLILRSNEGFQLEPQIVSYLGMGEMRASMYKTLSEIPDKIKKAVIAVEDERFYKHHGIDLIGMTRALVADVRAMALVQGGSTITQQLAKNLLFSPVKNFTRKFLEIAAAISLETRYSKDKILELYLNEVYLGQEGAVAIHGVAQASASFFGKKIEELSLSEAATLAGIIRAPSAYSPRRNLNRAVNRRDIVLEKMAELGHITQTQKTLSRLDKLKVVETVGKHHRVAPHYVETLTKDLQSSLNMEAANLTGLNVYSGLNRYMQACGESTIKAGALKLEKEFPAVRRKKNKLQAALLAIEPHSGLIRTWVGGRDFSLNQYDHIAQAKRQIGSTIKPFLYLTALDSQLNTYRPATPLTIVPDEPLRFEIANQPTWEPENFDHKFRGDVTVRYALEHSLNMPAAYIATRVGLKALVATVTNFKVGENVQAVPSLALGAVETTLLRLTAAYGAIANGGIYVTPRLFVSALDGNAQPLVTHDLLEERVSDEDAVYVLTNMMQGVIDRGTARIVRSQGFAREAAGKTGTSNDTRDAWFVAFTPSLVVGVWVGFDDNSKTGLTGGQGAAPIWTEFMKCVEPVQESFSFLPPDGVSFLDVDAQTGGLATRDCPTEDIIREVFVKGTEPLFECPQHGGRRYDYDPRRNRGEGNEEGRTKRRTRGLWDVLFGD